MAGSRQGDILYLQLRMFYEHKGTEKRFDQLPVNHAVYLAESISGDSSFSHGTAFCQAESPRENSLAMVESPAFTMLSATLDELTGLGLIPRARRPYTEMVAWSSAHGLAALIADGPLAAFPEEEREAAINRTLDATIEAICTGA